MRKKEREERGDWKDKERADDGQEKG